MTSSTFSSKDAPNEHEQSYTSMSVGDVEAIGARCQAAFCHQLDFLPFKCESCKGKFCLEHRTESAHACSNAGAWARARTNRAAHDSNARLPLKPSILNHESQCSAPSCKTLINTPLVPGIECNGCNRSYCLKHRMKEDHECDKLTPIGARPKSGIKGFDEFIKFKMFNASRKAAAAPTAHPVKTSQASTSSKAAVASRTSNNALQRIIFPFTAAINSSKSKPKSQLAIVNTIKANAKGREKIPEGKRIYLHVEAVPEGEGASGARIPRCDACFNRDWTVGKMLDEASKMLSVTNVNNRGGGEEQKLRVYHVDDGRLLSFSDRVGASGLADGHTIVLLRGVGDPDAV